MGAFFGLRAASFGAGTRRGMRRGLARRGPLSPQASKEVSIPMDGFEEGFAPHAASDAERAACVRRVAGCVRFDAQGVHAVEETVAAEVPVSLSCNGVYVSVLSCSPMDLEDLAYGALFTTGVIARASDVAAVDISRLSTSLNIDVTLREGLALPDAALRLSSLSGRPRSRDAEDLAPYFPARMVHVEATRPYPRAAITAAANALLGKQGMHRATGATHAASFVSRAGEFMVLREDVGRHNALDKLIGALVREGRDPHEGFVFLSSRCALELVNKAARFGVELVATVSAPTSAVIEFATEANVTLAAFARDDRFTVYTHPERIEP